MACYSSTESIFPRFPAFFYFFFFFSSRRRHTRFDCDWIQTCALPIYRGACLREGVDALDSAGRGARPGCPAQRPGTSVARGGRDRAATGGAVAARGVGRGVSEIGRASCRERGEISVVAVSLKKKKKKK